ncbi:hypothetical protein, partial [Bifidobacterium jacchi]|uniref:hypothetical protein n=1 Tax=Bifidobacterium jacchi TaxID=2490545 RepID=UPI00158810BB
MRRISKYAAAIIAAGVLFGGVGVAHADEGSGSTELQPMGSQAQVQNNMSSKSDASTEQQTLEPHMQSSQTEEESSQTGSNSMRSPIPSASTPTIVAIQSPQRVLKWGAKYGDNATKPTFKVTLSGLTKGQSYGVSSNISGNYDYEQPQIGGTDTAYAGNEAVFTATAATQTVEVKYAGGVGTGWGNPPTSAWFALLKGKIETGNNGWYPNPQKITYVTGPVLSARSVQVKFIRLDGSTLKLTNQRVDEIGQHTVGLKANYSIDSQLVSEVKSICYSTTIVRVFRQDGKLVKGDWPIWADEARSVWDCVTNRIPDSNLAGASAYASVRNVVEGNTKNQRILTQYFNHGYTEDGNIRSSGTITHTIPGLFAGTKYGNWGYSGIITPNKLFFDLSHAQKDASDPASMMYSGLSVQFKDGSIYTASQNQTSNVPTFTTSRDVPNSEGQLNNSNKGGVTGNNGGKAKPDSVYRLYIDSLKNTDACIAASKKGDYCYWTGYIFSTPRKLTSPDGQASAVRIDPSGRAYVEFKIPAGYKGSHKIAIYSETGRLKGWSPVTVGTASSEATQTMYRLYNRNS